DRLDGSDVISSKDTNEENNTWSISRGNSSFNEKQFSLEEKRIKQEMLEVCFPGYGETVNELPGEEESVRNETVEETFQGVNESADSSLASERLVSTLNNAVSSERCHLTDQHIPENIVMDRLDGHWMKEQAPEITSNEKRKKKKKRRHKRPKIKDAGRHPEITQFDDINLKAVIKFNGAKKPCHFKITTYK
ncbi:unnamed protein product, partial [Larinioides sclopetarius]